MNLRANDEQPILKVRAVSTKVYAGSDQISLEVNLECSALVGLTADVDAATQRFDLCFDKV